MDFWTSESEASFRYRPLWKVSHNRCYGGSRLEIFCLIWKWLDLQLAACHHFWRPWTEQRSFLSSPIQNHLKSMNSFLDFMLFCSSQNCLTLTYTRRTASLSLSLFLNWSSVRSFHWELNQENSEKRRRKFLFLDSNQLGRASRGRSCFGTMKSVDNISIWNKAAEPVLQGLSAMKNRIVF